MDGSPAIETAKDSLPNLQRVDVRVMLSQVRISKTPCVI